MDLIPVSQVFVVKGYQDNFPFYSADLDPNHGTYPTDTASPNPAFIEYYLDFRSKGTSSDIITIGTGTKSFTYSDGPTLSSGNLVRIDSYSDTVKGYMLGQVTSYSFSGGASHIIVNVYQAYGNMTDSANQWYIKTQFNANTIYTNIEENPNSPHTAKLCVWNPYGSAPGATFLVPYDLNITGSGYYETVSWRWYTSVTEDFSDLHKPWLGTTVGIRLRLQKDVIYPDGTSETSFEYRDYSHTFNTDDFNPDSENYTAGAPSTCFNYSDDYIDSFTNYSGPDVIIRYTFRECWITSVSPASFFEPPT